MIGPFILPANPTIRELSEALHNTTMKAAAHELMHARLNAIGVNALKEVDAELVVYYQRLHQAEARELRLRVTELRSRLLQAREVLAEQLRAQADEIAPLARGQQELTS